MLSLPWQFVSDVAEAGQHNKRTLTVKRKPTARKECLEPLIAAKAHRILLDSIKTTLQAIQAQETAKDSASTAALYQRLLHAIRALKSIYVAIVALIDPYGAQAAMSELVLASAHARARALGLAVPAGASRSPAKATTSTLPKARASNMSTDREQLLSTCADQMFIVS